jgi:hypothetical protein
MPLPFQDILFAMTATRETLTAPASLAPWLLHLNIIHHPICPFHYVLSTYSQFHTNYGRYSQASLTPEARLEERWNGLESAPAQEEIRILSILCCMKRTS